MTTTARCHAPAAPRERGAILIVSMLLLLVLTTLALATLRASTQQDREAADARDLAVSFQAAEAALRAAEEWIDSLPGPPNRCATLAACDPEKDVYASGVLPDVRAQGAAFWTEYGREYGQPGETDIERLDADPRYVVEAIGFVRDSLAPAGQDGRWLYRVYARGTGSAAGAQAVVESTFARRFSPPARSGAPPAPELSARAAVTVAEALRASTSAEGGDRDLGHTDARPTIAKLRDDRWVALFGNGYGTSAADGSASTTGNAVLYVVDLTDGRLLRMLDTGAGSAQDPSGRGRGNGMSSPAAVDLEGDGVADLVYAGDLQGNLWKFDLSSSDEAEWNIASTRSGSPVPLFRARAADGTAQSIVSKPVVSRGPRGVGTVVLFGTGEHPGATGPAGPSLHSFYGIYDDGRESDRIADRTQLAAQRITTERRETVGATTFVVRTTTAEAVGPAARGWYLDLKVDGAPPPRERQISDSVLRAGKVLFTTHVSEAAGGTGWLYALDAFTGARPSHAQFDLNGDGAFDDRDVMGEEAVSAVGYASGRAGPPVLLGDQAANHDLVRVPGSLVPGSRGERPCVDGSAGPPTVDGCSLLRVRLAPFDRGRQSWRQLR